MDYQTVHATETVLFPEGSGYILVKFLQNVAYTSKVAIVRSITDDKLYIPKEPCISHELSYQLRGHKDVEVNAFLRLGDYQKTSRLVGRTEYQDSQPSYE